MRRLLILFILLGALIVPAQAQQVTGSGNISGAGTMAIVPPPSVNVAPLALQFGSVLQNTPSAFQTINYQNLNSTPVTILTISIQPPYNLNFNCVLGVQMAGGTSCAVNINFTPNALGPISGTMTITDNSPTSPHVVSLNGTGITAAQPVVNLTPSAMNFGSQVIGTSSPTQQATLQNTGGGTLTITSITASAKYSQSGTCGATLAPNASCVINVAFSPTATGVVSGTLSIADNASGSPHTVSLTGTGVASGSGIPLTFGWFSIPNTNYRSVVPTSAARPDIQGNTGPAAIIDSWGGGDADIVNNRLYFLGGGHHDYCGNQAIMLDLNTLTINQTSVPSTFSNCSGAGDTETMPDGSMSARHTYGGMAFADGELWFMGGGITGNGALTNEVWRRNTVTLNPAQAPGTGGSNSDTHVTSQTFVGGAGAFASTHQSGNIMGYDPSTDTLWIWEPFIFVNGSLWQQTSKSPVTWTARATPSTPFNSGTQSGTIDSVNHAMYIAGGGHFEKALLAAPFSVGDVVGTGCNLSAAPFSSAFPGIAYDSNRRQVVLWSSGNNITVYDPATNSCTTETYTGGPNGQDANYNGTLGRFRYFPQLGVFAVCENADENCFALRRNIVNGFLNRTNGVNVPGGASSIVSVQNFNNFPVTNKQQYFQLFKPAQINTNCTIAADGCSLQIHMNPGDFQGEPGWFTYNFADPSAGALYGQNSEFYVQFKARHSSAFLNSSTFLNGTDFKLAIYSEGDSPTVQAGNCSNTPTDFVLDSDRFTLPWIYENCGGDSSTNLLFLHDQFAGVQLSAPSAPGGGNFWDQPASGCPHYTGRGTSASDPTCWNFVPDEFATYQVHIKPGTWGTASSVIDVWACHPFQPCVTITNAADIAMNDKPANSSVTDKFGKVTLLPYATGATWQNTADVYYDDLIISNRRLPDPEVSTPQPPELLLATPGASSVSLSWRVNSQNGTAQDDTGFLVERCTGTSALCNGNPQPGYSQIGTTIAGASIFTDNTAVTGTTYTYRVRAKNGSGNSGYAISICFNGPSTNCGSTATAQ